MQISKFSFYSIGIVAANKPLKSKEIEVFPQEVSPMASGELSDNKDTVKAKAKDSDGAAYQVEMESTISIKATWLPIGSSNRLTAPDVRRGETVVIYRFADTDQFWWSTLKDDSNLRRLETVIYGWSANPVEDSPVDADNFYFLEISTHKKLIHFSTTKKNKEFCTYDIQINTADGFIMIQDDLGNYIGFDSKNTQIEMKNKDGSLLEVNKKNINQICVETITQQAKAIVQKCETHTMNASSSTDTTTGSHTLKANTSGITATTTHTGPTTHKGNFTLMGGFKSSGAGGGGGSVSMTGTVDIQGTLTNNGVNHTSHTHPDAQGGNTGGPQ